MQKELAMFGTLSQFQLGGKLSFMMAFYQPKKSPLKRYCAVQDLTETLVKGANIVKDL